MSAQDRIRLAAHRRLFLASAVSMIGRALLVATGLCLLALLLSKATGTPTPHALELIYSGTLLVAVIVGVSMAWAKRPDEDTVVTMIDDRLGLKDRLSTSRFLQSQSPTDDAVFQSVIAEQAELAASQAQPLVKTAFKIKPTKVWKWLPVAVAVFALTALILPNDFLGLQSSTDPNALSAQAEEEIQKLEAIAYEKPEEDPALNQAPDAIDPDVLMDQVAELLRQPVQTPEAETAKQAILDDKAQQLEQIASKMQTEQDRLQNQLSRLDSGMPESPGAQLEQALRNGDLEKAQQELEALTRKLEQGELTEEQKKALQQQMQQMAQQLSQAATPTPGSTPQNPGQQPGQQPNSSNQNPTQQQMQQLSQSLQKMGQCANPQQSQNGKPQNAQQASNNAKALKQASQQASQSLQKMQQSQRNLQSLKQCQGACQNPNGQKTGQGAGQRPGQGSGAGKGQSLAQGQGGNGGKNSTGYGRQLGGEILGQQENRLDENKYQATGTRHLQDGSNGRQIIINSPQGPMIAGEATKQFNTVRRSQSESIERAVAEDRLPTRYNKMRQSYFGASTTTPKASEDSATNTAAEK